MGRTARTAPTSSGDATRSGKGIAMLKKLTLCAAALTGLCLLSPVAMSRRQCSDASAGAAQPPHAPHRPTSIVQTSSAWARNGWAAPIPATTAATTASRSKARRLAGLHRPASRSLGIRADTWYYDFTGTQSELPDRRPARQKLSRQQLHQQHEATKSARWPRSI